MITGAGGRTTAECAGWSGNARWAQEKRAPGAWAVRFRQASAAVSVDSVRGVVGLGRWDEGDILERDRCIGRCGVYTRVGGRKWDDIQAEDERSGERGAFALAPRLVADGAG